MCSHCACAVKTEPFPLFCGDFAHSYLDSKRATLDRSTLWRLNTHILNESNIKESLNEEIKAYLIHNNDEVLLTILWDALKAVIRGKIISISSHQKKASRQKLSSKTSCLRGQDV